MIFPGAVPPAMIVHSIGHSTRPLPELAAAVREHGIARLVDVRRLPRSRRNPQFNADILAQALAAYGLTYTHLAALGGLRRARRDSPNHGWRNAGFRGYADYLQTPEFDRALQELLGLAAREAVAVMCAEALPWRCHRWLIADALTVRGIEVRHILGPGQWRAHALTRFARVEGLRITYPFALEE